MLHFSELLAKSTIVGLLVASSSNCPKIIGCADATVTLRCQNTMQGFAGVYFERVLKKGKQVSLFAKNLQLSAFAFCVAVVVRAPCACDPSLAEIFLTCVDNLKSKLLETGALVHEM